MIEDKKNMKAGEREKQTNKERKGKINKYDVEEKWLFEAKSFKDKLL